MGKPPAAVRRIFVQERDIALLSGMAETRYMTSRQIADVFFAGSREYAKKRLQALKAAGMIRALRRTIGSAHLLSVTEKGRRLVRSRGVSDRSRAVPDAFLPARSATDHDLRVQDFRAAFSRAFRSGPVTLSDFSTSPAACEVRVPGRYGGTALAEADAFIALSDLRNSTRVSHFYLEVDRSTESLAQIAEKAMRYASLAKAGNLTRVPPHPFRVLMVFETDERRNNAIERLLDTYPPIHGNILAGSTLDVLADPKGDVWIRPGDYQPAMKHLLHDRYRPKSTRGYRRQVSRDLYVAAHVPKVAIIDTDNEHRRRAA